MRGNYHRVFQTNPEALAQMLTLRLTGWKIRALSTKYSVDRTSIRYWCEKYEIEPILPEFRVNKDKRIETPNCITYAPVVKNIREYKYQSYFDDEAMRNTGKSYADYIRESKLKEIKKRKEKIYA